MELNKLIVELYRKLTTSDRGLILYDSRSKTNSSIVIKKANYNTPLSCRAIGVLFDATMARSNSSEVNMDELPIASHLGMYPLTVVIRKSNGEISVHDGMREPVDNYIGVG